MAKNKFQKSAMRNLKIRDNSKKAENIYSNTKNIHTIDINRVVSNPYQPRLELNNIDELKESIKSLGLIQPLTVKKDNDKFVLIYGHRRLQALKELGKSEVDVIIDQDSSDEDIELKVLVENLQRDDLEPLELAFTYKNISDKYNLSMQELATKIAKSKAHVGQIMLLLKLDSKLIKRIKEDKYKTLLVLNRLNTLPKEQQLSTYIKIKDMSRKEALEYIENLKDTKKIEPYRLKSKNGKYKIDIDINQISKKSANEAIDELNKLIDELKRV
jgi:ParB family chromosome partitioning protein